MTLTPVPVFYPTQHGLHAPEAEYDNGLITPYAEVAERIEVIKAALLALPFVQLEPATAVISISELEQVHAPELLNYLRVMSEWSARHEGRYYYPSVFPGYFARGVGVNGDRVLGGMFAFDIHAPIGMGTETAVFQSAASALSAAQVVLEGKTNVAYALCRPPGHHAGRSFSGGYCYLNNAVLAANRLKALGKGAILDIDYHHGNGTQDMVWDDPEIFFASLHADPAFEYPYYCGYVAETGGPHAPDTIANFPLPKQTSDELYLTTLHAALEAIEAFAPNWLVVSLGFDTFGEDPICTFALSEGIYQEIGKHIKKLALPTVLVQEGGYAVSKLGDLAQNFMVGITGF
ncbi:MAG: histone deacetylase family protein [Anaerolineae bacterium]|nr:histone deacetylase family protein [Anaerolineae bacterium]